MRRRSGEVARFEGRIGLVDRLELLLGGLVAAMRVRVMRLDELLVARLEADEREGRLDAEDLQRRLLRGERARLGRVRPRRLAALAEEAEPVVDVRPAHRVVAAAEGPARPLPGGIVADFRLDLRLAHPGIVVPGRVVGADMVEAEPKVDVESGARARRTKIPGGG